MAERPLLTRPTSDEPDTLSLRVAIDASRLLRSLKQEYELCGIPVPKHIPADLEAAMARVKIAYRQLKEAELDIARAHFDSLKSREEKREDWAKRIAELEEELG